MEFSINKQPCIVYNSFTEMVNDKDIIEGMVVMTLGYDRINDGEGGIYKIITKDQATYKKVPGQAFGRKSPLYAEKISLS